MTTRGVERIVERQMRNWELARGQHEAQEGETAPPVHEYVAISRQYQSGGLALAEELGRYLGWEVYDQQILNYMAHDDRVQERIYEFVDEHKEGHLELILKNLGVSGRMPGSDYFRKLVASINAIARAGHAIFVGRGAQFMLPAERGLRVRAIASGDRRVGSYAEANGCSVEKASESVRQVDADRERFIREYFNVDPANPELYDVVLNLGAIEKPVAVSMIAAGLERKTGLRLERDD